MTYQQRQTELELEALKELRGFIDQQGSIVFWDNTGDMDYDNLYGLPCQLYISKHYEAYNYYITRLDKVEEDYMAHGLDPEEGDEEHYLLSELDTDVIFQLIDLLKAKFQA